MDNKTIGQDYKKPIENIRSELKEYVINNNIKSLVLGMSGGVDSTLCALLAKPVCDELHIPLIGVSLPSVSNNYSETERAYFIGNYFCTEFQEIELQGIFHESYSWIKQHQQFIETEDTDKSQKIRLGNLKARLRMIYLYDTASLNNGLVLSTDNYTERLLGFWTLHGDEGDYGMIQNLWKTEVYEMTEWIMENEVDDFIKRESIEKVLNADATDGLGISKTDLDQIMPKWRGNSREGYQEVDKILKKRWFIEDKNNPVIKRNKNSQFKRNIPINIERSIIF